MAGVKIRSRGEILFGMANSLFMVVLSVVMFFPFLIVLRDSLDHSGQGILTLYFLPREITLAYYRMVFHDEGVYRPFLNSIFVTVIGTVLALIVNASAAYTLSKRKLRGNRFFIYFLIIIPIIFHGGGIIANYIWYKMLGLLNTFAVLILPVLVQGFWIVIIRQFYWSIPESLSESAEIDGAGEFTIFRQIIAPMSKAVFSAYCLFKGVSFWNTWITNILYVSDPRKFLFPIKLRSMLFVGDEGEARLRELSDMMGLEFDEMMLSMEGMTAAIIIVGALPIFIIYPYLQKHFAAGVRVGAIKG